MPRSAHTTCWISESGSDITGHSVRVICSLEKTPEFADRRSRPSVLEPHNIAMSWGWLSLLFNCVREWLSHAHRLMNPLWQNCCDTTFLPRYNQISVNRISAGGWSRGLLENVTSTKFAFLDAVKRLNERLNWGQFKHLKWKMIYHTKNISVI